MIEPRPKSMSKKVKKLTIAQRRKERRQWERELLAEIRHRRQVNSFAASRAGVKKEALSVYPSFRPNTFPIREFKNRPVPKWRYTTPWMKVYACVWVMQEEGERCLALNVNLHPDYEYQLTTAVSAADIRMLIRNRIGTELRKIMPEDPPTFFFAIEGRSKDRRAKTPLHIHGAVLVNDASKDDAVREALKRACGHYIKGRSSMRSAARLQRTYRLVNKWAAYCMKNIQMRDDRLDENRIAMSRPLSQAARYWWELATDTGPK